MLFSFIYFISVSLKSSSAEQIDTLLPCAAVADKPETEARVNATPETIRERGKRDFMTLMLKLYATYHVFTSMSRIIFDYKGRVIGDLRKKSCTSHLECDSTEKRVTKDTRFRDSLCFIILTICSDLCSNSDRTGRVRLHCFMTAQTGLWMLLGMYLFSATCRSSPLPGLLDARRLHQRSQPAPGFRVFGTIC